MFVCIDNNQQQQQDRSKIDIKSERDILKKSVKPIGPFVLSTKSKI